MISLSQSTEPRVIATKVPCPRRCSAIATHLGDYMLNFENRVYDLMGDMCDTYGGGFWEFYELSNGGFFMNLCRSEPMTIRVRMGNNYEGTMSPTAASIVVNLFAYSQMSFKYKDDYLIDHYYWLIEYAGTLDDFLAIRSAID